MVPVFLITVREVIEATAIVTTLLGLTERLKLKNANKIIWWGTGSALLLSILVVYFADILGFALQELYKGRIEQLTEGFLMITSSFFITGTVFFLHRSFSLNKAQMLEKVKIRMYGSQLRGLFLLVFAAVLREGFEIALFLSTLYISSPRLDIWTGFLSGLVLGIVLTLLLYRSANRLPLFYVFRISSIFLLLFSAGLIARGVHEFIEAGIIPEILTLSFAIMPREGSIGAAFVQSLSGLTKEMDILQVMFYLLYLSVCCILLFYPDQKKTNAKITAKRMQ